MSELKPPRSAPKKRDSRSEDSAPPSVDSSTSARTAPYSDLPASMTARTSRSMSPGSVSPRASTSVVTSAPSDAVRHYETLSKLHKQLAELETVLAHELAHHVHNDLPWGLALEAIIIAVGMWLATR